MNKCISCGKDAPFTWFCSSCCEIKEKAYKESARLNENWVEVIIRRDNALKDHK